MVIAMWPGWDSVEDVSKLNAWVLGLAALFGFLAAIFVVSAWFTGNRLSDLQDAELSKYKTDSAAKVAEANERAGEANERAGIANKSAGEANERAKQLDLRAEQLHKENLELEASLSPRLFKDQGGAGTRLSRFIPIKAVIEYAPDVECKRTAGQISVTLNDFAKWTLLAVEPSEDVVFDGVLVQLGAQRISVNSKREGVERIRSAVAALVVELNRTNIKARTHAADFKYPEDVVIVRVGIKPNPAMERIERELKGGIHFNRSQ
jgi:hypothetical protein